MTQEEQAIEDKFNQLYERYKVWPHIPPTEQELFCKLLLDSNLVRKITLKAFSLFKETMASQANGLDSKTYKSFCASSVFDTIIKIFEKFEPTEGNFIRYFSSSYKRMLGNRIKEDFIDTGSQTTFYPLPPKRIKAIKRVLEQQEKLRGKTLTYDAKLEYLQTQFKLSPYEAEFVLTPQRCNIELISRTDLDDAYNDDDDSISPMRMLQILHQNLQKKYFLELEFYNKFSLQSRKFFQISVPAKIQWSVIVSLPPGQLSCGLT